MIIKKIEIINIVNFRDFDQNPSFIEHPWKVIKSLNANQIKKVYKIGVVLSPILLIAPPLDIVDTNNLHFRKMLTLINISGEK